MNRILLLLLACHVLAGGWPSASAQSSLNNLYAYGEAQRKSLPEKRVELGRILKKIESHYEVSFMYNADLKNVMVPNRFDPSLGSVAEQLDLLMKSTPLDYAKISENFYVIRKRAVKKHQRGIDQAVKSDLEARMREVNVSLPDFEEIFEFTISGKVSDQQGDAIPGVNVLVKGTSLGTTTDMDGKYRLTLSDEQNTSVLVFSFIGFVTQEVSINNRNVIDVRLEPDIKELQEIVVVGYGTQKSESVTGAISSMSSEEVSALPVVSIESAMQGRMPGVSVVNNGSPGEAPIVRIRGIGSISYAANPLYVVDGFPIQGINTGVDGFPGIGLNNFDSKDIESIDVLKDASASAIYGSRAANGVIMITTKKGKNDGGIHVGVESYYGWQTAWNYLDMLKRDDFVAYGTALRANAGNTIPARYSNMNEPIYPGADQTYAETETDWQREVFRTAPLSHTHLSLSGGNDHSRLYSSVGYFKQEGIMLGTGYERVSFRFNSDHNLGRRVTFGQNLALSYDEKLNENSGGGRSMIKHVLHSIPYIPVYDPTQPGGFRAPNADDGSDPENPVRIARMDRNVSQGLRLLANAYVDVELFDWLHYRFTGGVDMLNSETRMVLPIYSDSYNARSQAKIDNNRYNNVSSVFTNQLTFDKTFGKHTVNAVAAIEQQSVLARAVQTVSYYNDNNLGEINGPASDNVSTRRFETLLYSYLGRVNYEYAGKYLFSASLRRDGSSVFAPGNKWGNFPAASVGWRISEEPFLQNNPTISELKVRASYGVLGFNGIGAYDWQQAVSPNTTVIIGGQGIVGSFFEKLGNTELEWEKTKMWNAGVDLGLLGNRITFSVEVYNRLVDNLILQVPAPTSFGYAVNPTLNVGEMKNWGYEVQVGYSRATGDFQWDLIANLGITRNEVLELSTPNGSIYAGEISDYSFQITKTEAGHPIQGFYGYVTDGIFQTEQEVAEAPTQTGDTAPGDIRFKDLDDNGVIDSEDRAYLGNFIPDFNYGLNFSASYRNFDVTLFIQGVQGNDIYNLTKFYRQGMQRLFGAGVEVKNAWTPDNTNTSIPRAVDEDPNQNVRTSDRFIEDGSYLRLKNLTVGYSLPAPLLASITKGTLTKARFYVATQNLLTITDYSGYDPEIGSRFGSGQFADDISNGLLTSGIDYGQFPSARSVMIGIQLGF